MRKTLSVWILIGALAIAGCGQPKETIVVQTVVAPQTVIIEQTVEVTRAVTATPLPVIVAPTQQVAIPASWVKYENIIGRFTLWHPAEWTVYEEKEGGVALALGDYGNVVFYELEGVLDVGTTETMNNLVRIVVGGKDTNDTVKFIGSDTIDFGLRCDMCQIKIKRYMNDSWTDEITLVCSRGKLRSMGVIVFRSGGSVLQDELDQVFTAIASIEPRQ